MSAVPIELAEAAGPGGILGAPPTPDGSFRCLLMYAHACCAPHGTSCNPYGKAQEFTGLRDVGPFTHASPPLRSGFVVMGAGDAADEVVAVRAVPIPHQVLRSGVVGKRLDDLLGGPLGGRVLGDVEVDDLAVVQGEHDKREKDLEVDRGHGEEIHGDELRHVVLDERPPGLQIGSAPRRTSSA
jgi:hypothetical protein